MDKNKIMKSFKRFLNEARVEGNLGIPEEYRKNHISSGTTRQQIRSIKMSDPAYNPMTVSSQILNIQVGKEAQLEELAKKIIIENFSDDIIGMFELTFKLGSPPRHIQEECKNCPLPSLEVSDDIELKKEVDRRKIFQILQQGEARNVMSIVALYDGDLKEIFGETLGLKYLNLLRKMQEICDFSDWSLEIEGNPENLIMSGAVEIKPEDEEDEEDEKDENNEEIYNINIWGIDLLMLVHEAVKGLYWGVIGSIAINEKYAGDVLTNTQSIEDELENIRFGGQEGGMAKDLRDFISSFPLVQNSEIKNITERVYRKLSDMGKEKGIDHFLNLMNEIFYTILMRKGKINKNIPMMNRVKKEMNDLIKDVIMEYGVYHEEKEKYDEYIRGLESGEPKEMEEDQEQEDTDSVEGVDLSGILGDYEVKDEIAKKYSEMNRIELENALSQALEEEDYEEATKIQQYLKK